MVILEYLGSLLLVKESWHEHNLPVKAYGPEEFKRSAIDERQTLYAAMAEIIWSPSILD